MNTTTTFRIHAIPPETLAAARDQSEVTDDKAIVRTTAEGGEPLRCCLTDATEGERLVLFGYEPSLPLSPYRELGPVFAHAGACEGSLVSDAYPTAWRGRPQVLRAYDEQGWIRDALVHDGSDPETAIDGLLSDPEVTLLHSRNVAYGCFMFVVTRN